MIETLEFLVAGYVGLSLIAIGVVAVTVARRRAERRRVLSYCSRSSDGTIYVRDPQTGTEHNLATLLQQRAMKSLGVADARVSGRQARRARRNVRRHLRAVESR